MPLRDMRPQDTLEGLIKAGMNPREWGSCAPNEKDKVIGCGRHPDCPWKGRHVKKNGEVIEGPANKGIRTLKILTNGMGSERTVIMPCFDYLWQKSQSESNGAIMDVVGEEGEEIVTRGTKALPLKPGDTIAIHEDVDIPVVIPPYERLTKRHRMAARIGEIRKEREAQRRERKIDQIVGLEPEIDSLTPASVDDVIP
jgi:hypothetical protein